MSPHRKDFKRRRKSKFKHRPKAKNTSTRLLLLRRSLARHRSGYTSDIIINSESTTKVNVTRWWRPRRNKMQQQQQQQQFSSHFPHFSLSPVSLLTMTSNDKRKEEGRRMVHVTKEEDEIVPFLWKNAIDTSDEYQEQSITYTFDDDGRTGIRLLSQPNEYYSKYSRNKCDSQSVVDHQCQQLSQRTIITPAAPAPSTTCPDVTHQRQHHLHKINHEQMLLAKHEEECSLGRCNSCSSSSSPNCTKYSACCCSTNNDNRGYSSCCSCADGIASFDNNNASIIFDCNQEGGAGHEHVRGHLFKAQLDSFNYFPHKMPSAVSIKSIVASPLNFPPTALSQSELSSTSSSALSSSSSHHQEEISSVKLTPSSASLSSGSIPGLLSLSKSLKETTPRPHYYSSRHYYCELLPTLLMTYRFASSSTIKLVQLLLTFIITIVTHFSDKITPANVLNILRSSGYFSPPVYFLKGQRQLSASRQGRMNTTVAPSCCTATHLASVVAADQSRSGHTARTAVVVGQRLKSCQILREKSDFICIIALGLCLLSSSVTPVTISNDIYPMDSASHGDREIEGGKWKNIPYRILIGSKKHILDILNFPPCAIIFRLSFSHPFLPFPPLFSCWLKVVKK